MAETKTTTARTAASRLADTRSEIAKIRIAIDSARERRDFAAGAELRARLDALQTHATDLERSERIAEVSRMTAAEVTKLDASLYAEAKRLAPLEQASFRARNADLEVAIARRVGELNEAPSGSSGSPDPLATTRAAIRDANARLGHNPIAQSAHRLRHEWAWDEPGPEGGGEAA